MVADLLSWYNVETFYFGLVFLCKQGGPHITMVQRQGLLDVCYFNQSINPGLTGFIFCENFVQNILQARIKNKHIYTYTYSVYGKLILN